MPLPPGLFLNRTTGVISGTPSQAGTFSGTLRVRDAQNQSRDLPYSITILPYTAPSLTGSLSQYAMRTKAYTGQLTANDGTAPFVWSIASGTLPTGISIDAGTGAISGTPTDTTYGERAMTVRAVDALGSVAQYSYTLRYANALSFTGGYPGANIGTAYSFTPTTTGGHLPLSYALSSGALPAGLTLDPATGRVFGTPTTEAAYSATITCTDAAGNTSAASAAITVSPAYTPVAVAGSVTGTSATIQKASGAHMVSPSYASVTVSGGNGSYTYAWARTSGSTAISPAAASSLSTGFTGTVSPGASQSATFRCTISDGTTSATLDVTITITNVYVAPSLSGTVDTTAMRTKPYSSGYTVSDGVAPYTWARTSGTLPTGLSLNSSTGVISGTPTDTSYTNRPLTIRVTDAEGQSASSSFTLQYVNLLALSGSPAAASKSAPYSYTPTRTGGYPPITYSIASGTLPTGLSLNTSTGEISGTPTVVTAGAAVTIRAADSDGHTADNAVTFVVNDYTPIAISGTVSGQSDTVNSYPGSKTITPNYGSLSVTGGNGSISYSWVRISGSTAISASNPSTLATSFSATASPGTTASAVFRVTADDGVSSATFDLTVQLQNIYVQPSLSGTLAARSTRTVAYSSGLTVSGGVGPFTWNVTVGTLPTGLTISASTGVISGTPTDTNFTSRNITVAVTDSQGRSATSAQTITYRDVPDMVASTLAYGWRTAAYSASAAASNAASAHALTYSITAGTLPTGITLDSGTGLLSGTPTSTSYGNTSITVRATDPDGNYDEAIKTLPYADILAASENTPNAASGVAYSGSVSRTGGHSPFTYSLLSGTLPSGISLNGTTGTISGSSTALGSYAGTFRVTDAGGKTADVAWAMDVVGARLSDAVIVGGTMSTRATIALNSNGTVTIEDDGGSTADNWMLTGAGADYEVRGTMTSTNGVGITVGTFGSWIGLGSNRTFGVNATSGSIGSRSFTLEIRRVVDSTVLATATYSATDDAA